MHPDYIDWYNEKGGPATYAVERNLISYHPETDSVYYATVYAEGWTSVDGDDWWGEFPSLEHAQEYLGLVFIDDERYSVDND